MTTAPARELPLLPVQQPEFAADPMPFIEAARRVHPWLARCTDGYFVHGYQALKDLAAMDGPLVPGLKGIVEMYGAQGTPWARYMEEMVVGRSGPEHTRIRNNVADAFSPRIVSQARPLIERIITELLDDWVGRRKFDFAEFAAEFPIAVVCGMLGISTAAIPGLRRALETQVASAGIHPELLPQLLAGYDAMWTYTDQLVKEREAGAAGGEDTMLDTLIARKNAGLIDETELRFLLMTLLPGAYDTSKNLLTMTMYLLLDRPTLWQRCAADRSYCDKVIEEVLRHTSVASVTRMVAEEFEYSGVRFPQGSMLILAFSISGRDPAAFPEPLKFDPDRVHINRHIAFGRGAHICIARHLARVQIADALHRIAQRIPRPRLAGPISWRPFLPAWGLATLPIAFDPA
jgi:cytochrome P450